MSIFKRFKCDPGEARTLDPLIKSQLLYQLSYGVIFKRHKGTDFFYFKSNMQQEIDYFVKPDEHNPIKIVLFLNEQFLRYAKQRR